MDYSADFNTAAFDLLPGLRSRRMLPPVDIWGGKYRGLVDRH